MGAHHRLFQDASHMTGMIKFYYNPKAGLL